MFAEDFDWSLYLESNLVVANFVMTCDGKWRDSQNSSRGISNALDREVLIRLRQSHSAILTGGETARVEGYRASSRFKTYILSRSSQDLVDGLDYLSPKSDGELIESIRAIRARHDGLLIEAGPSLLAKLVSLGLVDRLFLTIIGAEACSPAELLETIGVYGFAIKKRQQFDETSFLALEPVS